MWLGATGIPFSYRSSILRTRVASEAIGTSGVVGIYTSTVITFLVFGGNAVTLFLVIAPRVRIAHNHSQIGRAKDGQWIQDYAQGKLSAHYRHRHAAWWNRACYLPVSVRLCASSNARSR
jgi:hypothetical protein